VIVPPVAEATLSPAPVPSDELTRKARLSLSASDAPVVVTVTLPVLMHVGTGAIELSAGAVFAIVSTDEFVFFVDAVQVFAIEVCSQFILSPFTKLPASVVPVCPDINAPFLYHLKVRAPVFSESPSGSDQVPAVQVMVEAMYAGMGVRVGAIIPGIASGYACDALVACADPPALSVNVIVTVVEPGVVATQL